MKYCFVICLTIISTIVYAQLSFVQAWQASAECYTEDVVLGDVDGDEDLDIFIANNFDGVNSVIMLNDGDGGFSVDMQQIPGGARAANLGDMNNDDNIDLCFVDDQSIIRVWFNDGEGTFTNSNLSINAADGGEDLCLAHLNNDNFLDIFVLNLSSPDEIFFNNGDSTFTRSSQTFGPNGWDGAGGIDVGDLNGDGHTDLIKGNWEQPKVQVWLNNGEGVFSETNQDFGNYADHIHGLKLGDLDGDNDLDVFLGYSGGSMGGQIWLNDGDGNFTLNQTFLLGSTNLIQDVVLTDFDNDDDLDVFLSTLMGNNAIGINDGTGTFTESDITFSAETSWASASGDINGDGRSDLFVSVYSNESSSLYNSIWINETITDNTGILHNSSLDEINIYPNPADQTININSNLLSTNSSYKLLNVNGECIKQEQLTGKSIDVPDLRTGLYILEIQTEANKFIDMVVIK